jgi:phosphopantetheinyl transferase (holo-ACP synthase)
LLGDDLVDLADAEAAEGALHPRFDARAFAPAELAALAASRDRHALRWSLWAAKEAAYKAARRLDGAVRFHPRAFFVEGGIVRHGAARFRVTTRRAGAALHVVAVPEGRAEVSAAGFAPVERAETPSAAARRLARAAAAQLLGCDPAELAIESALRVPRLLLRGAPCAALSLSHHGAYAGFALAIDGARG